MQLTYRHGRRSASRRSATGFTTHTILVLVLLSLAWGSSFLFIKSSLDGGLPPTVLVFVRTFIAALALWGCIAVKSLLSGRHRTAAETKAHLDRTQIKLSDQILLGLLGLAPMALVVFGEQFVSSGVAGIVNASDPLWTALLLSLIARKFDRDPRRWMGIIVGFGGVMIVMSGQAGGFVLDGQVIGLISVLMSASMYSALGVFVSLRMSNKSSLHVTAVGMTWSALFSLPFALPNLMHAPMPINALANAVALGLIGGACGFGLFYYLLSKVGATRSAFVVYLMPIVAVVLGAVVRHESITLTIIAGMVLIISGIGVANTAEDGFERSGADQLEAEEAERDANAQPWRTKRTPALAPGLAFARDAGDNLASIADSFIPGHVAALAAAIGWSELSLQPLPWQVLATAGRQLTAREQVIAVSAARLESLLAAARATRDPVELAALRFAAEIETRVAHDLLAEIAADERQQAMAKQPAHEADALHAVQALEISREARTLQLVENPRPAPVTTASRELTEYTHGHQALELAQQVLARHARLAIQPAA
ncbi:MAG: DMT family transporter [Thermoleophilia bacterium]|nr:DMT family transporter [Thermoleophilia bacterium]